jgi:hypothetical protein
MNKCTWYECARISHEYIKAKAEQALRFQDWTVVKNGNEVMTDIYIDQNCKRIIFI